MVRLSKREKQDKRELLSSLNQMNSNASKHEADNGEYLLIESNQIKMLKEQLLLNYLRTGGGLLLDQ